MVAADYVTRDPPWHLTWVFPEHDGPYQPLGQISWFPSRAYPAERFPPFETLMAERDRLFARHPKTIFVAAVLEALRAGLALKNIYFRNALRITPGIPRDMWPGEVIR